MSDHTAPIPPVPDQPSPPPAAPTTRRARLLDGRFGLPVLVGAGGVVAGAVLAFGVSAAGNDDTVDAQLTAQNGLAGGLQQQPGRLGQQQGGSLGGGGEPAHTGDVAAKVTAAVEEKYPDARILRLEEEADGVYEAHVVNDGQLLRLLLDSDFTITQTDQGMGGGPGLGQAPNDDGSTGSDTSTT
jgi:hypothetical protein